MKNKILLGNCLEFQDTKATHSPFFSLFLLLLLSVLPAFAQQEVLTSGGNAQGIQGNVSYTVGQVSYLTYTGTNGSLSQGMQQPLEISVVLSTAETSGLRLLSTTYPNPTTGILTLVIENYPLENLSFQLYNLQGQLLLQDKVFKTETAIDITNQGVALYFLKILSGSSEIKTFKIQKK